MNRIHKLDGLRGLFALFVVLFHFNKHNAPQYIVNNFFVRESYMFVDFFFILSGFVITLSYDQKITNSKTFFQFLKKRWNRLYPLLFFSTFLGTIFGRTAEGSLTGQFLCVDLFSDHFFTFWGAILGIT